MKELYIDQIELDRQFLLEHEREPVWTGERVQRFILSQPAVDAVRVVRCKDCWAFVDRHGKRVVDQDIGYCGAYGSTSHITTEKEFCARGSVKPPWLKK